MVTAVAWVAVMARVLSLPQGLLNAGGAAKKKKKKKEGKLHAYVEVLYIIKISSSSKVIGPLQRLIHQEVIL